MGSNSDVTTMNVSLPRSLRDFVESEAARTGCTSTSEYVRRLIAYARTHPIWEAPARTLAGEAFDRERARDAIGVILELQKKLELKGLTIEQLIDEGRDPRPSTSKRR